MKLKKTVMLSLATLLCLLLLASCKGFKNGDGTKDKRLVSAIAFEGGKEEVSVILETVEAEEKGEIKPRIFSSSGSDIDAVMAKLSAESGRELSFSHPAVVILENEIKPNQREKIFSYLLSLREMPLSVKVVSAESPKELLEAAASNGRASGYEISDVLKSSSEKLGIAAHTTLYEIETARLQKVNIYALPQIEEENETVSLDGMRVFVEDSYTAVLNYEQSVAYAVIRNTLETGEVYSEKGVFSVTSPRSKIVADFSSGRLLVDIKIRSAEDGGRLLSLVESAVFSTEGDVFGIEQIIKSEYPEIYEKIRNEYADYFKKAKIRVIEWKEE